MMIAKVAYHARFWSLILTWTCCTGLFSPDITTADERSWRGAAIQTRDRSVDTLEVLSDLQRSAATTVGLAPLNWVKSRLSYLSGSQLRQTLNSLVRDKQTNPFVRIRVGQLLSRLHRAAGDLGAATETLAPFGIWDTWMLRGYSAHSGLPCDEIPFEPTDPIELSNLTHDGFLDLGAMLWPKQEGAAFVEVWLTTDVSLQTVLRLGSDGPFTAWINGQKLGSDRGDRDAGLDQVGFPVKLTPGTYEVRFRVCTDGQGPFRIIGRATDRHGNPQTQLRVSTRRPLGAELGKPRVMTGIQFADPVAYWTETLSRQNSATERIRARWALRELGKAVPSDHFGMEASERWELAQDESDRHTRAQRLHEALNADPDDLRSLVSLAQLALDRQRPLEARELLERAIANDPDDLEAQLLFARLATENQATGEAMRLLRRLLAQHPDTPAVLNALAALHFQRGDLRTAAETFDRLYPWSVDPLVVPSWQREIASAMGESALALEWSERLRKVRTDLFGNTLVTAKSALDAGLTPRAVELLQTLHPLSQRDPEILEEASRLWIRLGNVSYASELARQSLSLKPQNTDLRRLLMRLSPQDAAFEDEFRKNTKTIMDGLAAQPAFQGMEYVADHKVIRVYENGLSSAFFQRLIRVSGSSGKGQTLVIPYDPYRQQVNVQQLVIHKPDGRRVTLTDRNERAIGEDWYGMYFDLRHLEIPLDRLEDGDVLVAEYRIDDVGQNLFGDTFSDLTYLQDVVPKREATVTYIVPKQRKFHFSFVDPSGHAAHSKSEETRPTTIVHTYAIRDVPALAQETGAPGLSEHCPYVHVSTFESYPEVARYYLSLSRTQAVSNDAIKRHVQTMTSNLTNDEDKIKVLYNDLTRTFRYVGLEFGVHGYKPYSCPVVFGRKFGDCKDQSTLLVVMLRELGIEAHVALLRTRSQGTITLQPASLSVFDHAIVFVPKGGLWLDPTAMFNGIEELPSEDQGALALIIDEHAPRIVTTPQLPAETNRTERGFELRLKEDGSALLSGTMNVRGLFAPRLRQALEATALREKLLEEMIAGSFPGFVLDNAEFVGLDDIVAAPRIIFSGTIPQFHHPEGDRLDVFGGAHTYFVDRLAPDSTRTHNLLLDFPFVERTVLRIVPPPGWVPTAPTPTAIMEEEFARYYSVDRIENNTIVRTIELNVPLWRIESNNYSSWRNFLKNAESRANATCVFRRMTDSLPEPMSPEVTMNGLVGVRPTSEQQWSAIK